MDTTERLHFHFSLSCLREGNGNPLQCSCLEDPRDRGAWWAATYGVAQNRPWLEWFSSSSSSSMSDSNVKDSNQLSCAVFGGSVVSDSLNPLVGSSPGSSVNGDSQGKNTRVGCHALLQGIFPPQGSNPILQHCRQILYLLSHRGCPRILEWVACPFSRGFSQPRNPVLQVDSLPADWSSANYSLLMIPSSWQPAYDDISP